MSSLTYSFTPGEIITAGTTLELRAAREVNSQSAQGAIRLFRAGKQVPAIVATRDNVIQLSTDKLSPGSYHVSVSKLLDTEGETLAAPSIVPVVVGGLRGRIPEGYRVHHAIHMAVGDTSATRLRPGEPEIDGTEFVGLIKAMKADTQEPVALVFDASGNQVDDLVLLADVRVRRFLEFRVGRLHEIRWNRLQEAADTDITKDDVVWPRIDRDHSIYEKLKVYVIQEPLPQEP